MNSVNNKDLTAQSLASDRVGGANRDRHGLSIKFLTRTLRPACRNDKYQSAYVPTKTDLPDSLCSIVIPLYRVPKEKHFIIFCSLVRHIRQLSRNMSAEGTMCSFSKQCQFYTICNPCIFRIRAIMVVTNAHVNIEISVCTQLTATRSINRLVVLRNVKHKVQAH